MLVLTFIIPAYDQKLGVQVQHPEIMINPKLWTVYLTVMKYYSNDQSIKS